MTIRELIEAGILSLDTVVLGELPMTADGVLFAQGFVYCNGTRGDESFIFEYPATARWVGKDPYIGHLYGQSCGVCYSTREAAEAARSKK